MMPTPFRLWIGFDPAQLRASAVAELSAQLKSSSQLSVRRLALSELVAKGLYTRPTRYPDPDAGAPGYWDVLSDAPMSTGHAIARFLVPALCEFEGWALFTDGDVLFRADVAALFALADPRYAVQVVQHQYAPTSTMKMRGQAQTIYTRKNWSSVMLWYAGHPANRALTVDFVNQARGRDLHQFCWLADDQIGALPEAWNFLVGHSSPAIEPALVHFTEGTPDMPGYADAAFAKEWYGVARTCGYSFV